MKAPRAPEVLSEALVFLVAGAGFAECYTQPTALWIDLLP
jgi:hypothetical protein